MSLLPITDMEVSEDYEFVSKVNINDSFLLTWIRTHPEYFRPQERNRPIKFSPSLKRRLIDNYFESEANPPLSTIVELLNNTGYIDNLLYLTQKRHRDHNLHQLKVTILGLFLLRCKIDEQNTLLDYVHSRLLNKYRDLLIDIEKLEKDDVLRIWIIAALIHDSGFPFSHLNRACMLIGKEDNTNIAGFIELSDIILSSYYDKLYPGWGSHFEDLKSRCRTSGQITNECARILSNCFESYLAKLSNLAPYGQELDETRLPFINLVRYLTSCSRNGRGKLVYDHGLWSSANLIYWFTRYYDINDNDAITIKDIIILEAIDSITIHNAFGNIRTSRDYIKKGGIKKLDIGIAPLTILLQICDEIHEWGRNTITEDESIKEETTEITLGPFEKINQEYHYTNELKINLSLVAFKKLHTTGWLLDKFCESKAKLAHLDLSNIPNPQTLSLELTLPILQ